MQLAYEFKMYDTIIGSIVKPNIWRTHVNVSRVRKCLVEVGIWPIAYLLSFGT